MVSILDSIKQLLGIDVNDNNFDAELIIHINEALMILNQLGVGPEDGYSIVDKNNTWDEFIPGQENLEAIKSSVYLRVRSIFDPPQNSFLVNALEKQMAEYDWRITLQSNTSKGVGDGQ